MWGEEGTYIEFTVREQGKVSRYPATLESLLCSLVSSAELSYSAVRPAFGLDWRRGQIRIIWKCAQPA